MLNIVVINCDDRYVEYEWTSKEAFIEDMESGNENIPMLDDALAEVNTQDDNLQLWWRLVICRMNGIRQTIYSGVNH